MKKIVMSIVVIFIIIICSSCKINVKVEYENYNDDILEKYNMIGLPKYTKKDCCVVEDRYFYFTATKEEFLEYTMEILEYINDREDILFWGKTHRFDFYNNYTVYKCDIESAMTTAQDNEDIVIAFTTMELEENVRYDEPVLVYKNCFVISLNKNQESDTEETIYKIILYDRTSSASSYFLKV